MADNFFGFNTEVPSQVLGRHTLEEELLTDDVEDEYDALNDETFGHAANDDWEEAHEKLSELIKHNNFGHNSVFNDSLLENDESQDEIVSKSISQLGLEDDLDDPAIMTIARNCNSSSQSRSVFGSSSSPPPPAILETLDCGSPKTHSIWSTTPKDSGIASFLQSIGHQNHYLQKSQTVSSSSDNVFTTPPKAWRAEELERDLLSKESPQVQTNASWPSIPNLNRANQNHSLSLSPPRMPPASPFQNNRMLTREEVERQMHADPRLCFPPPNAQNNFIPPQMMPHMIQHNLISPIGSSRPMPINVPNHSSPVLPLRPARGPMIGNSPIPDPYLLMKARMSNVMPNRLPLRAPAMPNIPPGFAPSNMNVNQKMPGYFPRIAHPLLNKHFQFPMVFHNKYYGPEETKISFTHEDEYAGLMNQREREWLIKIQMLLLKTENPYIEDYYFTTQVARRCRKKYESANKGAGDAPELILPQCNKPPENKAYVPTQFAGSLGKLQAVSVNFPRKVLDITVTRPLEDEEGRVVTNQSLVKYRRLLIDIEKMYTSMLEIEDEERRILAKPDSESGPHRENIKKYIESIYDGLFSGALEDNFQPMMTIRKGRSLLMRVFKIFNKEQQLKCLSHLFQCLCLVLKKDQNDHVLLQNIEIILNFVNELTLLSDLVHLSNAMENDNSFDQPAGNVETNNLAHIVKYKFGSSVICKMILKAEQLYSSVDLTTSEDHSKWSSFISNLVHSLCLLPNSSIASPVIKCANLLDHLQRFTLDNKKLDVLRAKCKILENSTLYRSIENNALYTSIETA